VALHHYQGHPEVEKKPNLLLLWHPKGADLPVQLPSVVVREQEAKQSAARLLKGVRGEKLSPIDLNDPADVSETACPDDRAKGKRRR